jgi:hypothetical protein
MSWRFSLTTLLMLTAIVAATANLAFALYRESAPIDWMVFTYADAEALQHDGHTVLFFGNATYHAESQLVLQLLNGSRVATAAHRGEIVPLMRTYDGWDDSEIRAVWRRYGFTKGPMMKGPMILLFKPDGTVTQMEPLFVDEIERQVGSRSVLPIMPLFSLVGAMLASAVTQYYTRKDRNRVRTALAGRPPHTTVHAGLH